MRCTKNLLTIHEYWVLQQINYIFFIIKPPSRLLAITYCVHGVGTTPHPFVTALGEETYRLLIYAFFSARTYVACLQYGFFVFNFAFKMPCQVADVYDVQPLK